MKLPCLSFPCLGLQGSCPVSINWFCRGARRKLLGFHFLVFVMKLPRFSLLLAVARTTLSIFFGFGRKLLRVLLERNLFEYWQGVT